MATIRVLLLTAGRLDVYDVMRGALDLRATFCADAGGPAAGLESFVADLRSQPRTPVRLVIDVACEEFHLETVPLLRGGERRAVIERRRRQRFPGASLGLVAALGETRGERREERVLLGAYTLPQVVQPWIDALRGVGVPIAGVYSAAQFAAPVLARLKVARTEAALVTSGTAGMRQTFVQSGRLRFSRLTPSTASSPEADAATAEERASLSWRETRRLHQYLRTSGCVDAGATITAALIAPAAIEFRGDTEDPQLEMRVFALEAVAHTLGLRRWPAGADGDALAVYLAATAAPREQYADEALRADTLRRRWHRVSIGAGGVAAAVFLSAAAGAWLQAERLHDQTEMLRARVRAATIAEEKWGAERNAHAQPLPTTSANIIAIVRLHRALRRESEPMATLLRQISVALTAVPAIELDSLRWQRDPSSAAASQEITESADIVARVIADPAARGAGEREAARSVTTFMRALERQPGVTVVEARLPFVSSPTERLAGDLGAGVEAGVPTFTLRIARRGGHEAGR